MHIVTVKYFDDLQNIHLGNILGKIFCQTWCLEGPVQILENIKSTIASFFFPPNPRFPIEDWDGLK